MFDRKKDERIATLEEVNSELEGSLEKCRALLSECRGKLAANSNAAEPDRSSGDAGDRMNG